MVVCLSGLRGLSAKELFVGSNPTTTSKKVTKYLLYYLVYWNFFCIFVEFFEIWAWPVLTGKMRVSFDASRVRWKSVKTYQQLDGREISTFTFEDAMAFVGAEEYALAA
jgi:hypothetical protein